MSSYIIRARNFAYKYVKLFQYEFWQNYSEYDMITGTLKMILPVFVILTPIAMCAQFKPVDENIKEPILFFYKWKFNIGINIVDDKGTRFKDIFKTRENWNALPYPSRISVERHLKENFSSGLLATFNRYKEGKNINGILITSEQKYRALDAEFKYFFNTGVIRHFDAAHDEEEQKLLHSKNFKKTYNGKPTKRYLKIMEKIKIADRYSYQDIEMMMLGIF